MLLVKQDFQERVQEISRYFDFLQHFSDKQVEFKIPPKSKTSLPAEADELFKTLKANGFLLLYNLVESTLKNAIESIFEEFKIKNVSYDACRLEVKEVILRNLKGHDVKKVVASLSAISEDVVIATFRKEDLASGNVDGKLVRRIAREFGFTPPSRKSNELLTVKTNRNDLAHGQKSFAEVGRDFDLPRLKDIKDEVIRFLEALLDSIENYLAQGSYLSVVNTVP